MILTAHQPQYLPGPRLLHKMAHADVFVVLDHLPFSRGSFENRNKIRTAQGWQWLTVPVIGGTTLNEASIVENGWPRKHYRALEINYHRALHWACHREAIKYWDCGFQKLSQLTLATTTYLSGWFGIESKALAFTSPLPPAQSGWRMILELCQGYGADTFLFGSNGRDYMTEEAHAAFRRAGVKPLFQAWESIPYKQVYDPFIPDMSALDILLNLGPDEGRDLIYRSGRFEE